MTQISVCIVNYNCERFLKRSIDSVLDQGYDDLELIVVDNASNDKSRDILRDNHDRIKTILNEENEGYCAAVNKGINSSGGDYFLCMNSDVFLQPSFIKNALETLSSGEKTGSVSGKLLRYDEETEAGTDTIDSAGIILNKAFRAYDRGSGEKDTGQYDKKEEVFAACGAAAFYKRDFLEDIKYGDSEYFDELFFAYKEDVDIAWRGHKKGWKCVYTPDAVAYHVRGFKAVKRKEMPEIIRYHSFKNRHILLMKNLSLGQIIRNSIFFIPYDICLFTYALIFDRKLIKAYFFVLKNIKGILRKRHH